MKRLLIGFLTFVSLSSFAATTLECKSANYTVTVSDIEDFSIANYSVNGKLNDGADVEVEKSYLSDRIVAVGLSVDGQSKKIEVSATKNTKGFLIGKIFFGKTTQNATCTRR